MFNHLVEQKVAIQVSQGREFPPDGTPVHRIAEQLLDELTHMFALGIEQRAFVFLEKEGELSNVCGVGGNGERSESLFDLQIVDESVDYARFGCKRHIPSMRIIGHSGK